MTQVRQTLNERGGRYGRFDRHAMRARYIINIIESGDNFQKLAPDQQHALCYIADKIARILEGDPDYTDNWHDIAGYATLIEDRLNGTGLYAPTTPIVQASQCGLAKPAPGSIVRASDHKCTECFAILGDAHAPDCKYNQDPAHSG